MATTTKRRRSRMSQAQQNCLRKAARACAAKSSRSPKKSANKCSCTITAQGRGYMVRCKDQKGSHENSVAAFSLQEAKELRREGLMICKRNAW